MFLLNCKVLFAQVCKMSQHIYSEAIELYTSTTRSAAVCPVIPGPRTQSIKYTDNPPILLPCAMFAMN